MTGAFSKAIEDIAIRSAKDGGPTPADLLEAMVAGHDESIATAADLAARTEKTTEELSLELKRIVAHLESESDHMAAAIRALSAKAIEAAKAEVIAEIESREHWPVLDKALADMWAKLDHRYPRRATDTADADWTGKRRRATRDPDDPPDSAFLEHRESAFPEDAEMGDLRRAWRVTRWFVAAGVLIAVDMFARFLSHTLFGYPR